MFVDRSIPLEDIPQPPTLDEVARDFPLPLLTLVAQDSIDDAGVGTSQTRSPGRVVVQYASISYTLWRNPVDRDDPANLAELPDATRESLETLPPWPLPEWILTTRERMRYPALWEAVRTTHVADASAEPWHTPEYALVQHINYVLMNTFRSERVRGRMPGELLGRATERAIEHDIPVSIDGERVPGMRIDTDAHVLGLGADLGDRMLTAVIAREHLPFLDLAFSTLRRDRSGVGA